VTVRQDGAGEQHCAARSDGEQIGKESEPIGETGPQRIRTAGRIPSAESARRVAAVLPDREN
jgi:hypothetical protein